MRLDRASVNWQHHEMRSLSVRHSLALDRKYYSFWFLLDSLPPAPAIAQTNSRAGTVWDGVYTEAQAARGLTAFGPSCAGCHALAPGGAAPLVGDAFWKSFAQKNVGDVLEFVSAYMPNGKLRVPSPSPRIGISLRWC